MATRNQYRKLRELAIQQGTWNPWADPEPVILRVKFLRGAGASYGTIASAAGIGAMTVWQLANVPDARLKQSTADALMAVRPEQLGIHRLSANAARLRLRSLMALGHCATRMARALGLHPQTVMLLINGKTATVTPRLNEDIRRLWEAWWDKRPPARDQWEKGAIYRSIRRAAARNWCCPAALDEDQIDQPGYVPEYGWRPATGTGIAGDYPLGIPEREAS